MPEYIRRYLLFFQFFDSVAINKLIRDIIARMRV